MEEEINVAAYFLSEKNLPFDRLCWMLAEKRLERHPDQREISEDYVRCKAAEVYFSNIPYDVLCWCIAEMDILTKYEID